MKIPHPLTRSAGLLIVGLLFVTTGAVVSTRQVPVTAAINRGVLPVVHFDVSAPLGEMAREAPTAGFEGMENPDPPAGQEVALDSNDVDTVVQGTVGDAEIPSPGTNFDTLSNTANVAPPDPVADVGPNHYVVMSNLSFAIYSKTGTLIAGPALNNTLWAGFGGACQTENAGDPIVLYDQFADRWLLTQFTAAGPNYFLCVALSTTGNPAGTYYSWAFSTGTNFPDYPKFGVWPTASESAYFASTREFSGGATFAGVGAYAFNRTQMIAGNPAPVVFSFLAAPGATPYSVGDGLLPADVDGSTAPANGTPGFFLGSQDDGGPFGAPSDAINLWKFAANFTTATASFTLTNTLLVAAVDTIFPCSPGFRDCIPQPGTTQKLDHQGYRQRLLHRAAYRNYGTHQSIALNQSVEASAGVSGVRWYELRSPSASPVIFQQGTFAPGDGIHRWFGSAAMDKRGNLAIGYSASNASSVFPGIRYTGRRALDPLGTLPAGEGVIVNGTGSQTTISARWGDYTSMNVDPSDDCTFWYTNQYIPSTSLNGWRLRAGSFRFPDCPALPVAFKEVHSTTPMAIPDLSTIESPITISGVAGVVGEVRVSLHLTHTFDGDLNISLIAPDGTIVDLSSRNGGGGDNYGTSCASAGRTHFADDSSTSILSAAAPFVGTYRPEQPLATFAGKTGAAVNGTWRLRIADVVAGDVGTLLCWSLSVEPAFHNTTALPIPDLATVESPITVSGIIGNITDVRLSLHLTHTFDGDLQLFLIAPDGTARRLAINRGGDGDNYGTGCSPRAARTTFADTAPQAISAGSAPFEGAFRPEETLAAFKGKGGAAANGTWRLRIQDTAGGDVGTLHCWSLHILSSPNPLDFDADGDPDLLWQHPNGQAVMWRMNGTTYTGDASYLYSSPLEWHLRGSADFDHDGDPDLIWQHPSGAAVIWVMNGTLYTGDARYLYTGSTEWRLLGAADFTGDDKPDLIWQDPTGRAVIWVMDGTTYTGDARALYSGSTEWRLIGAGDFTDDRKPDLIWQHPSGSAVIWVMDGTNYFGDARYLYSGSTEWILKGGADYTLDGKLDLVWQHPTGMAVIWVMDGTRYMGDARYLYSGPTEWKVVPR